MAAPLGPNNCRSSFAHLNMLPSKLYIDMLRTPAGLEDEAEPDSPGAVGWSEPAETDTILLKVDCRLAARRDER